MAGKPSSRQPVTRSGHFAGAAIRTNQLCNHRFGAVLVAVHRLACVLREGRKNANIRAGSIWGTSTQLCG